MKRRQAYSSAVLIVGYGLLASPSQAFVAPSPPCSSGASRHERHHSRASKANTALAMAWGPAEKAEILSGLVDWQERDADGVGAADIQILTESSPTAVLTRYYESLAKGEAQEMLLVAPSCTIESECTTALEAALSSSCTSKVYHPDVEQGLGGKAPHLALWHEGVASEELSSSDLEQQTTTLSKKAVMEEVFLWLQRTMLGMVDDEEEDFVDLGRKLLTVHRYVVVKATNEVELSQAFWQEATALAKHGVEAAAEKEKKDAEEAAKQKAKRDADEAARVAAAEGANGDEAEKPANKEGGDDDDDSETEKLEVTGSTEEKKVATQEAEEEEDVLQKSGLGGGDDPREASVLMALPGFRFKDRAIFEEVVREKLVAPLKTLSPFGEEGIELSADIYAGEDLKFPVMIVSPQLKTFEAPEGGYKFIYKGEEKDADEYIRTEELKMAEKANQRRETVTVEQDPLFGPRSPPPPPADEDSN
ncbi:unnamed protein product [Ectocarpus fasciculatus]